MVEECVKSPETALRLVSKRNVTEERGLGRFFSASKTSKQLPPLPTNGGRRAVSDFHTEQTAKVQSLAAAMQEKQRSVSAPSDRPARAPTGTDDRRESVMSFNNLVAPDVRNALHWASAYDKGKTRDSYLGGFNPMEITSARQAMTPNLSEQGISAGIPKEISNEVPVAGIGGYQTAPETPILGQEEPAEVHFKQTASPEVPPVLPRKDTIMTRPKIRPASFSSLGSSRELAIPKRVVSHSSSRAPQKVANDVWLPEKRRMKFMNFWRRNMDKRKKTPVMTHLPYDPPSREVWPRTSYERPLVTASDGRVFAGRDGQTPSRPKTSDGQSLRTDSRDGSAAPRSPVIRKALPQQPLPRPGPSVEEPVAARYLDQQRAESSYYTTEPTRSSFHETRADSPPSSVDRSPLESEMEALGPVISYGQRQPSPSPIQENFDAQEDTVSPIAEDPVEESSWMASPISEESTSDSSQPQPSIPVHVTVQEGTSETREEVNRAPPNRTPTVMAYNRWAAIRKNASRHRKARKADQTLPEVPAPADTDQEVLDDKMSRIKMRVAHLTGKAK